MLTWIKCSSAILTLKIRKNNLEINIDLVHDFIWLYAQKCAIVQ